MAVVVGLAAFFFLENKPSQARWIPEDEKRALQQELAHEESYRRTVGPSQLLPMLRNRRVLLFLLIYTLIQISTYGAVFYLPAEIAALMHRPEGLAVGVVSAIPWLCALAAVYLLPRAADARGKHRVLATWAMLIAGCASFVFPTAGPIVGLAALALAVSGFIAVQPIFWTFPTGYLADRAAAGGIAIIGMGNLGGFIAPNVKVWADTTFHSPRAGLYLLAAFTLGNAWLIATCTEPRNDSQR